MKRTALIGLAIFLHCVSAEAQHAWTRLTPANGTDDLTNVVCPAPGLIIATKALPEVLRSTNGGKTFSVVTYFSGEALSGISFCDEKNGMAVGIRGTALHSTDGGASWTRCLMPPSMQAREVAYASPSFAVSVGDGGRIMRTSDTGRTWTEGQAPAGGNLSSVSFPDTLVGYCGGSDGRILKSTDGGRTWNAQVSHTQLGISRIRFLDSLHGFAAANWTVLRTSDGGNTWTLEATSAIGVAFFDPRSGIAVSGKDITRTSDSARNWTRVSFLSGTYGLFNAIAPGPPGVCAIVGKYGIILVSNDSGRNFRQVAGRLDTDQPLGLHFPTPDRGYLCSILSSVYRSDDSGVTWQKLNPPAGGDYHALRFTSRDSGWVVGSGGLAMRTTDAGARWITAATGVSASLRSVDFTGALDGLIAGDGGTILRTSDGGSSWSKQWSGTRADLFGIRWTNASSAVAVGAKGTILRTADGGQRWVGDPSGTGSTLNALTFTDACTGWTSGAQDACLRTTDGGESWEARPLPKHGSTMFGVGFADGLWGVTGGNTNKDFRETVDGGETWTPVVTGTSANLMLRNAGFPHPSIGYVAAGGAQVFRYLRKIPGGPRLTCSSTRIGFGRRIPDSTIVRRCRLANIGSGDLRIDRVDIIGQDSLDFSVVPPDTTGLPPGEGFIALDFAFRSVSPGQKQAFALIHSNDADTSVLRIPLTATCVRPSWSCSTARLQFGDVGPGKFSERVMILTCVDPVSAEFPVPVFEGDDAAQFTCNAVLPGPYTYGDRVALTVRFSPVRLNSAPSAVLRFINGGEILPYSTVMLEGAGVDVKLRCSQGSLHFGNVPSGQSKDSTLTLRNAGRGPATIATWTIAGADGAAFTFATHPASQIDEGDSMYLFLRFSPQKAGLHEAILRIAGADPSTSDIQIPLSGFGIGPVFVANKAGIDFGHVLPGVRYRDTLTITNAGTLPLHITRQQVTGPDSAVIVIAQPVDGTLAPSASSQLILEYTPSGLVARGGILLLESDNTWGGTHTFPIKAFVVYGVAAAMPDSLFCDTVQVRSWKQKSFSLQNNANAATWISDVSLAGSGRDAFLVEPDNFLVDAGSSTAVRVRFRPLVPGPASALLLLQLQDSAARAYTVTVTLSGVGRDAPTLVDVPFAVRAALGSIHPQPAGGAIIMPVSMPAFARIVLSVHDALGRRVALIADSELGQGDHTFVFDTRALPPGVYLVLLDAGAAGRFTRLLLVVR